MRDRLGLTRPAAAAALALAATAAWHLGAQLTGASGAANVTQWFLMPLLALTVWLAAGAARRTRLVRLTVLALALSWLGDTAPDVAPDDLAFLTMLGFFLLAHVTYLAAFWPLRHDGVLRRPALLVPYAIAYVVLVALCAPGADALAAPVVVYGAVLTAVAVLATFDRRAAVGGVLFMLSDSLIAMNAFVGGYDLPAHGFWVMFTYVAAQVLLAIGVLRVASRPVPVPGDGAHAGTGTRPPA
ncbi:lysoplasmalogenase [Actinotalea fermentans]|uniref:Lysoplasmalogenase n=1 Tax=Actinotalea fermentans TaxID=43671 RepID=A0A511YYA2_9CELL|nr:lysoplasmalogenase [Actinotalea fermentans]GEN80185.1 hypothetical protein AFE02nite_19190 [Actinotalea fermentans]